MDGEAAPPTQGDGRLEAPAGYLFVTDSRSLEASAGTSTTRSTWLLVILIEDIARFSLFHHDIFKIGRDPRSNSYALGSDVDDSVSRNHCEFYVVLYDPSTYYIYVRDRPGLSAGYLLDDGDVVEIRPHWKIRLQQPEKPPVLELSPLQRAECKLCLGQGAEAVVHLAIDIETKKQLVCKLVNLDKAQGGITREEPHRRAREADVLRQLKHPNILPYVDAISSPHSLYIFTELASGGDLMSFIYRHEHVAEFDARIIIRQIVHGLRYLHEKGILHRDLKPENILLAYSPRIAYHRVMLSDFGTCAVPKRSRMVTNVGTTSYQAPEVQTKAEAQTSAIDIWSLGIVSLLLLTSGADLDIEYLNVVDQNAVTATVEDNIDGVFIKPSAKAKDFVAQCLQVAAEDRITTSQAVCHDWLCTPKQHLEFFEQLDERVLDQWQVHQSRKPKPMILPSLKKIRMETTDLKEASKTRMDCNGATTTTDDTESPALTVRLHNTIHPAVPPMAPFSHENQMNTKNKRKQSHGGWKGYLSQAADLTSPSLNQGRVDKPRSHKSYSSSAKPNHPSGCRRRPRSKPSKRQCVLDELKKTNSKFWAGIDPLLSV
ncbi:hypothetical protein S40293_06053 [Stachybotrys chartarum IBT 40293]|nr:hypothetical protein S40293_06053 [Stachybotrys chartarum IBT 40293]